MYGTGYKLKPPKKGVTSSSSFKHIPHWDAVNTRYEPSIMENLYQFMQMNVSFYSRDKGPRSSLCTQVPYLAVQKWNRSIINESNIFCKCIIPIIRK